MKATTTTYDPCLRTDRPTQERMRNQATGIGQTRLASERVGAMRSQRVIDAAPAAQRACADASYPRPIAGDPVGGALSAANTAAQGRIR